MKQPNESVMLSRNVNWNQVYYFFNIALHGSIKEAASRLGFSSPTLSEHLNQLEKDLGLPLFLREHRKLRLTSQGSRLFQHAKQMFEAGNRFLDTVAPLPLGAHPISVGLVSGPSVFIAYELVQACLGEAEPVPFKLAHASHADLEKGLLNAQFDYGFSDRPSERRDLISERVFSSFIRIFVGPSVGRRLSETISLKRLLTELPLLLCASEASNQRLIEHLLRELGLRPRVLHTSEYPAFLYGLCEGGQGVGLFNEAAVAKSRYSLVPVRNARGRFKIEDKLFVIWTRDNDNSAPVERVKSLLGAQKEITRRWE